MGTPEAIVVSGTDTDVGKTLVAAALAIKLKATYWKPVQTGAQTDADWLRNTLGTHCPPIAPSAYTLPLPQSPHWAAAAAGVEIRAAQIQPPAARPLVVEGAGGLLVPLNEKTLLLDVFQDWGWPVVVVVRVKLGCINHSLLSAKALAAANLPYAWVFNGPSQPEVTGIITHYSGAPVLGHLPDYPTLNAAAVLDAAQRLKL